MKRSEIVKVIQNEIANFTTNVVDQELLARRILGRLEDEGMAPPISNQPQEGKAYLDNNGVIKVTVTKDNRIWDTE